MPRGVGIAFVLFCAAVYLWTAPGRILFPDDEIVFQTTRAIAERGSLAIAGIPKRTGELKGRPDGTFGWAPGRDGQRYGFFGHGLALVALPTYAIGEAMATRAPEPWRHAIRSDHYMLHQRSQQEDWPRLVVSLTNCWVTPLGAWLFVRWIVALGFAWRTAVLTGLVAAFGTLAWPYSRTFLSEPLSGATLVGTAWCIAELHRRLDDPRRARGWAAAAGALAAFAVHVHVLNLVALPCLLGYALVPFVRDRSLATRHRAALAIALAIAIAGIVALLLGQWWRFGDPFETGRYDHYSWWIAPGSGLVALLVAPGRSVLLYSPALLLALPGVRALGRRVPAAAWCALAIVVTRLVVVGVRSDWWGGWAIGPRYLVPVLPFALLPLVCVLERAAGWSRAHVAVLATAVLACVALELHLALHSIFEWMMHVQATGTPELGYLARSHWHVEARPIGGFATLPLDTLSRGAALLAQHGHPGPWRMFLAIAAGGALALVTLVRALVRRT
ncbi:MAG TPA: hypothetical protein VFG69_12110 [Nannocystaceae bacterium]|nr:hypothetical protein [Nannocystaceae bacterium]